MFVCDKRKGGVQRYPPGTNISPKNGILKMIFLFPRWDMLVPWRVRILGGETSNVFLCSPPTYLAK